MVLLIHSQLLGSGSLLVVGVTGAMNVWTSFGWTGNLYPFCWNSKFLKANWQRDAMAWQLVFKAWFREAVEVRQTSIRDYYILSRIKAPLLNLCGKSTFSKEDEIMINFERNWWSDEDDYFARAMSTRIWPLPPRADAKDVGGVGVRRWRRRGRPRRQGTEVWRLHLHRLRQL